MRILKKSELSFDDFRGLAGNDKLSRNEKIDFPELYRRGYTKAILTDIVEKLNLINTSRRVLCDIGCGCGDLALSIISWAGKQKNTLLLVDSKEMLNQVPNATYVHKFPGKFPRVASLLKQYKQSCHAVLCYSVLQYVYSHDDVFLFIQKALTLLKPNGVLLLGDIPNEDKRDRFLKTPEGAKFTSSGRSKKYKIRDNLILKILIYYRRLGFETYLLPQNANLPMSNRREDILIVKPL